jgi:hypothetical protein
MIKYINIINNNKYFFLFFLKIIKSLIFFIKFFYFLFSVYGINFDLNSSPFALIVNHTTKEIIFKMELT